MRLLLSVSIALVTLGASCATAVAFQAARVAEPTGAVIDIAQTCRCTGGYTSGGHVVCTQHDCHDVLTFAPNPFKQVRSAKDCPRSRMLFCDYGTCKLVCDTDKK